MFLNMLFKSLKFYHHFLDLGGLIAEGASAVQAKGRHALSQGRWRSDNWHRNPVAFAQSPCTFVKYGDTIGMLGKQPGTSM